MSERPDKRWDRRGSALIVVLLVLLALTALGMVAMRTVGNSIDRSGTYRLRTAASAMSDGAARFFINAAPKYAGTLNQVNRHSLRGSGLKSDQRQRRASRGGIVRLEQPRTGSRAFELPDKNSETGLLTRDKNNTDYRSIEGMNPDSSFEIVVRNPSHAISKPGFSDDFCFRKVTVASRAKLGNFSNSWDGISRVGQGRTVAEGFVPVTNCK